VQVQSVTFTDFESATSTGISGTDRVALAAMFAATAFVLAVFWASAGVAQLPAAATIGSSASLVLPGRATSMSPPAAPPHGGRHA
jgi:hypothetical protein